MTLVVNLYGGPGTGKSTVAALTFGLLKSQGCNAELVTEFAKDLVWEGRNRALANQAYLMGKQMHRVHRLIGQVDVVVTDSPILLGCIYSGGWRALDELLLDIHRQWDTLDVFLKRNPERPYIRKGRTQSREEAEELDSRIAALLADHGVLRHVLEVQRDPGDTAMAVRDLVGGRGW